LNIPRIVIAGLRGGSGKTLVSLGLLAAWRKKDRKVAAFKKGPDYIDAAWLGLAAGTPCRNLDLFLMSPQAVLRSLVTSGRAPAVAVIEGNRGLFDGVDAQGSYSTAELAKLLQAPVVLAVDCTKATRTIAALVLGCQHLDPSLSIRGVILNQTAGPRHEAVLRDAIQQVCALPVLGSIPKLAEQFFPERHLGLVPPQEHDQQAPAIQYAATVVEKHVDLNALWELAQQAPALESDDHGRATQDEPAPQLVRIGVFRDAAFQFYYPENLEALKQEGSTLIEVSPLRDGELPEVDALYLGGGFPETLAPGLTANKPFLASLRRSIARGLPVYAECGGAVFLGEKLVMGETEYPMAGVLPVTFEFGKKPQGHGYVVLEAVKNNPFFPVGVALRGHEFHYTRMQLPAPAGLNFAFRVRRGCGFGDHRDGLCYGNVLACYTHLHALGTESWAPAVVRAARRFKSRAAAFSESSEV
jgi:cobyrinic acid a,c-diamide synthase